MYFRKNYSEIHLYTLAERKTLRADLKRIQEEQFNTQAIKQYRSRKLRHHTNENGEAAE